LNGGYDNDNDNDNDNDKIIIIIIIIIIIRRRRRRRRRRRQLIIGWNCYIASTQWKLKDTQEIRFSTPRNVRYTRELNLGMNRRRRRRNRRKGIW